MEPWTVVTTLSVLAALAAAVGGPLVKLNGTIARLSAMLEQIGRASCRERVYVLV